MLLTITYGQNNQFVYDFKNSLNWQYRLFFYQKEDIYLCNLTIYNEIDLPIEKIDDINFIKNLKKILIEEDIINIELLDNENTAVFDMGNLQLDFVNSLCAYMPITQYEQLVPADHGMVCTFIFLNNFMNDPAMLQKYKNLEAEIFKTIDF